MPWIENCSLSPADRVVVDWRISEYELVDDDETSQII